MEQSQFSEVTRRTDVVSYALRSEINHFHSERAEDFKQGMKKYLNEQILFYEKVLFSFSPCFKQKGRCSSNLFQ